MELDGHDVSVQRINDIMQSQNRQMIYGFPCCERNVHVCACDVPQSFLCIYE